MPRPSWKIRKSSFKCENCPSKKKPDGKIFKILQSCKKISATIGDYCTDNFETSSCVSRQKKPYRYRNRQYFFAKLTSLLKHMKVQILEMEAGVLAVHLLLLGQSMPTQFLSSRKKFNCLIFLLHIPSAILIYSSKGKNCKRNRKIVIKYQSFLLFTNLHSFTWHAHPWTMVY
jgi:hypothetical protein